MYKQKWRNPGSYSALASFIMWLKEMRSVLHTDLSGYWGGRHITDISLSNLVPTMPEWQSWVQKPSYSISSPLYLVLFCALTSSFIPINTTMTHSVIYNRHLNIDSQIPARTYIQLQWNLVHRLCVMQRRHSLSTHPRSERSHQLDSHSHSMLLSVTNAILSRSVLLLACHLEHLAFHLLPLYSIKQELPVSVFKALPSTPQPNLSLPHLLLQGQILFHGLI